MKHDPQAQIIERLDALNGKVDRIEREMVTRDAFHSQETKVDHVEAAMVTRDAFHSLETKVDSVVTRDEFNTTMDEVVTIVRRLDQERLFTAEWIKRIEADVQRVKQHLHLI